MLLTKIYELVIYELVIDKDRKHYPWFLIVTTLMLSSYSNKIKQHSQIIPMVSRNSVTHRNTLTAEYTSTSYSLCQSFSFPQFLLAPSRARLLIYHIYPLLSTTFLFLLISCSFLCSVSSQPVVPYRDYFNAVKLLKQN